MLDSVHILQVAESITMLRSIRTVLENDGYIVQILPTNQELPDFLKQKKDVANQLVDALESIRIIRRDKPAMATYVLVSATA